MTFEEHVIKLLQLPKRTKSATLKMKAGEPAVVECEYYPEVEGEHFNEQEVETLVKKYKIVPVDVEG